MFFKKTLCEAPTLRCVCAGIVDGVSYTQLNEVLNGKRALNTKMALLIGAALDIDAEPLLAMQTRYDMICARRDSAFAMKLKSIRKVAAVL